MKRREKRATSLTTVSATNSWSRNLFRVKSGGRSGLLGWIAGGSGVIAGTSVVRLSLLTLLSIVTK
jgi:hypothetical protein